MKRLILIQNDAPGTGKSSLAFCLSRYLSRHQADHNLIKLVDENDGSYDIPCIEADSLTPSKLLDLADEAPITILDIATGLGDYFGHFYHSAELADSLAQEGYQLSIVIPITNESDSFDSVLKAAEHYADSAEYTIAHMTTGAYDDDLGNWDRSRAARMMDLYDALEMHIPEVGFPIEMELRNHHTDLAEAIAEPAAEEIFGPDFSAWLSRALSQVESARQFLFGDAFVPVAPPIRIQTAGAAKRSKRAKSESGF